MNQKISAAMFVAAMAALGGCQHQAAGGGTTPATGATGGGGGAAPAGSAGGGAVIAASSAAPDAGGAVDHSGNIEQRLARIEDSLAQNAEALEFLRKVYDQQKAQQAAQDRDVPAEDAVFAVNIADDIKAGQIEGPASAPVTIVKAFDFACPYCQRTVATLHELVKDNAGKVRVVYMNMVVHPPAKPAHLASCAAGKQGKYKEFKDAFWDKAYLPYAESRDATKLGEDNIYAIAKDVGLNVDKLKTDMHSPACEKRIEADMAELTKFRVNATPTFFINGKEIAGALPKEDFQQAIDEQLKLVAASGVAPAQYYDKVVLAKGEKAFRSKLDPKPTH